ncbi:MULTISPECIES: FecR family protein [unclassified Acinetobacter]|uniref:FecR family protein n=1 Tax=unclassified Acinetobacter TaxID=196816 RepID=UPI00190DC616|nr:MULTISPECIES: FecR domain-containing protein [unclassified Acinetobacter]MBK0062495.1 FecR domain-containing protein [Acinetobacter sp. S55]MBK0066299.1 FecR domain-containing protein [Acinetobacter sp. S54]
MSINKNSHQKLVEEAANWIVQLSSDDERCRKQAKLKFEVWKKTSEQHHQVATDIEQCIGTVKKISQNTGHKKVAKVALKAGLESSKAYKYLRAGTAFAVVFVSISGILFYLTGTTVAYITADVKGRSGQWTEQSLPDGSHLILRGKSAVNLKFSNNQRVVELVQGQIYVDVAKDKNRPFLVTTTHGKIQALGTAFSVNYDPAATELKMLHSRVKVAATQVKHAQQQSIYQAIVHAGQAVKIDKNGIQKRPELNIYNEQQKWKKHQLMVENLPLNQVLHELDKNYKGKIIFNDLDLQQVRVNAVLPLDQTQESLKLLVTVFPNLKIKQITPYVIIVSLKQ